MRPDVVFSPIHTTCYPGPFSTHNYNVAVAFFSDEFLSDAVDTAFILQKFYSGRLKRQSFIAKLKKGERLCDDNQAPVSIYDGTAYFSKTNFIDRFLIELFYTDEVLIVGDNDNSLYEKYFIAACKLMKISVFRIKKNEKGLNKESISDEDVDHDVMKIFENELINSIEEEGQIEKIILDYDYDLNFHGITTTGEHVGIDLFFPNVPIQISRRIREWSDYADAEHDYWFVAKKFENEQQQLVGALNYFIGNRYRFETPSGSTGGFNYSEIKPKQKKKGSFPTIKEERELKDYFGEISDSFIVSLSSGHIARVDKKGKLIIFADAELPENHPCFKPHNISVSEKAYIQKLLNYAKVVGYSNGNIDKVFSNEELSNFKLIPKTKRELQDLIYSLVVKHDTSFSLADIDVSNIIDFSGIFSLNDKYPYGDYLTDEDFNDFDFSGLKTWNMSRATTLKAMFSGNSRIGLFESAIAEWDTSNVVDMSEMFMQSEIFNGDLSKWDVSSVEDMSYMFSESIEGSDFEGKGLNKWNVSNVKNMKSMFRGTCINLQNIKDWNVCNVTDMEDMFIESHPIPADLGKWDVSSVKTMKHMFFDCYGYNFDGLEKWKVSKSCNTIEMFFLSISNDRAWEIIQNWGYRQDDIDFVTVFF